MWHASDDNAPVIPRIPRPRRPVESLPRPAQPPRRPDVPRQAPPADK